MGWRSRRASLIQRGDGRGQVSGQMATADTRENGQIALFVPMDPLVTVSSWEAAGPHAISKEPFA
jgi:hypothetical protein